MHEDTPLSAWHHLSKHKLLGQLNQTAEAFCCYEQRLDTGLYLKEGTIFLKEGTIFLILGPGLTPVRPSPVNTAIYKGEELGHDQFLGLTHLQCSR